MLTVINKRDLEEAQKRPENYPNLKVWMGGFSEPFVNLTPETQVEILSRTLNQTGRTFPFICPSCPGPEETFKPISLKS